MELSEEQAYAIYQKYFRLLKHIAFKILHNMDEAENIAHDTFLKVLNSDIKYPSDSFISYISTICKNASIDRKRYLDKQIDTPLNEEIVSQDASPKDVAESHLLLEHLKLILTEDEYDILIYRIYYQLSFKNISKLTSKSVNQLIAKYHRIKKKVVVALGERI